MFHLLVRPSQRLVVLALLAVPPAFGQMTTIFNVDVNGTANRIFDGTASSPFFTTNSYTFTVSGISAPVVDVDFRLSLVHSYVGDLDVYLISPSGIQMTLTNVAVLSQGGSGKNFQDTYFDEQGGVARIGSVGYDIAPFAGPEYGGVRYKTQNAPGPSNPNNDDTLDRFNGIDPNGIWTLRILDGVDGDDGFVLRAGDNPRVVDDQMQVTTAGDTWSTPGTLAIGTQLIITVPEPQTLGLVTLGLAGVLLLASRSRRD